MSGSHIFTKSLVRQGDKLINFKDILNNYRRRTEESLPYTMMQVEDTMFVDDHTMISLEFIFYQKDGKHSFLQN